MLTEAQRRRLAEFEGRKWLSRFEEDECEVCGSPYNVNPNYSDWNTVMPLLAKIVERGKYEWVAFENFIHNRYVNSDEEWSPACLIPWYFANYTDPEHTAGLVAEWLERKEG
jgi:hypothetical protein